jgi:putative PIN family toxin of toxin-antitoxin system
MEQNHVIDTHCWVSIFHKKKLGWLLDKIILHNLVIYTTSEQLKEFADIHHKHEHIANMLPRKTEVYAEAIMETCAYYETQKRYRLGPDYKDNYLIDLALQTKSVLVSNDKGFRILRKFHLPHVKLITMNEFYEDLNM